MRRAIPLLVCVLLFASAQSLFAQQRLFANTYEELVELDPRLPSLGTVLRRFPLPFGASSTIVPFGGGAYLAWVSENQGLSLFDVRNGAFQQFKFPDFIPLELIGTDGNARLLLHGKTTALENAIVVADARSGSVRFLDLGFQPIRVGTAYPVDIGDLAYASATDLLFIAQPTIPSSGGPTEYQRVDVVRVSDGALIKTLDLSPLSVYDLWTNELGTTLYVTALRGMFAFNVMSGAMVASNTEGLTNIFKYPGSLFDEARNRIVAYSGSTIEAFSLDSLQSLGLVKVPGPPPPPSPDSAFVKGELDVSGQSATMFMLQHQIVSSGTRKYERSCGESQLLALDTDTGRVRGTASITATIPLRYCEATLARITEPAWPTGFVAEATGAQVTLRWQVTQNATSYEIEAGSASGLMNLATFDVTDTQLIVDGVPSGVYYLRVRAINTIGKSAPSQEIRLVVP